MSSFSTLKFASEEVIDRFLANVDVWQGIFAMLEVTDRIRLEMTNKRLRILMLKYWKRVTSFDTECLTDISDNPSMSKNRWAAFISICVDRVGDGLRSLTIREKFLPIGYWTDNLRSIGEGCPNIETINFVFKMQFPGLDIRFDSFSRLKTLTVSSTQIDFVCASPSVFLSIPASIEVIGGLAGIEEVPFENAAQMEGFFADRPSLREICLKGLYTDDKRKADMFRVIAERCPHLKSIDLFCCHKDCIDYSGVVALESMKELRLFRIVLNEMEIVTICERSPLVEALEFQLSPSSNLHLQSAALNALGALTKLVELWLYTDYADVVASSLMTEFVRDLSRNSGASLRRLHLPSRMSLPTAAIEALSNGCAKLRYVKFHVRVGEAEPASIRLLIDCIVAHPSWIPQTSKLEVIISVKRDSGDEYYAGIGAFHALTYPAANLFHWPTGVQVIIR